jgi:hypothetical protein
VRRQRRWLAKISGRQQRQLRRLLDHQRQAPASIESFLERLIALGASPLPIPSLADDFLTIPQTVEDIRRAP